MKVSPVGLLGIILGTLLCPAAGASDAQVACRDIAEPAARLECYDRANGRAPDPVAAPAGGSAATADPAALPAGVGAAAAAPKPVSVSPTPPVDPAANFGLSREKIAEVQRESEELRATVASVANHSQPGRWVVTLDNGQVWEQRETTPASRRPRPGDQVTIRPASLGSYLLSAPGRGSSRVGRIR